MTLRVRAVERVVAAAVVRREPHLFTGGRSLSQLSWLPPSMGHLPAREHPEAACVQGQMDKSVAQFGRASPGAGRGKESQELLALLSDLEQRGASGELICSCSNAEVHVFLIEGRIAWARDTQHRRAFTEYLKQHAGVDDSGIQAAVAESRRTKRPIGETLVGWNLATQDQVRSAILHQMVQAFSMFDNADPCRTLFLERSEYKKHDPGYVFRLSEVFPEHPSCQEKLGQVPGGWESQGFRPEDGTESRPGTGDPGEPRGNHMAAIETLKELQGIDGFAGAAVFTPVGERLAVLEGDAHRLKDVGVLANNVLLNSQKASLEMGAGRGEQVHVESENAHILVRCHNEGSDPVKSQPGKAHIHLVLVLKDDTAIGLAKMRMHAAMQKLADEFRV